MLAELHPIAVVRSSLTSLADAPKQGREGAPDAWLEVVPAAAPALDGLEVGGSSRCSAAPRISEPA